MRLGELKPAAGAKKKRKRVGCGPGSGHGKTSTKGHKGTQSRTGNTMHAWYEGGQMPLQRRVPKRGFVSLHRDDTAEVRLSDLQKMSADVIDLDALKEAGVVPRIALRAKVIVAGELKRKVALKGLLASKGARAAIEAAGGNVEPPAEVERAKAPRKKEGPGPSAAEAGETKGS